jgi:hypothetical protein
MLDTLYLSRVYKRNNNAMNKLPNQQKGASAIFTIILLAVLGYAVYVGIQYVPQAIESKSIDSILNTVKTDHKTNPVNTESEASSRVIKLLQVNEMNDMTDSFSVKRRSGVTTITFKYDRELNLIFQKYPMPYEKSLALD